MPLYDCGAPDCEECQRAFGPDRSAAIANYEARDRQSREQINAPNLIKDDLKGTPTSEEKDLGEILAEAARPKCGVCGEPMADGETMFKFHGSLGPCPKPPLPRPKRIMVEYIHRDAEDGFYLEMTVDRQSWNTLIFDTATERQRAHDDMLEMMRSLGAKDFPSARAQ